MILYPLPLRELFADATRRRVNTVIQRMVCISYVPNMVLYMYVGMYPVPSSKVKQVGYIRALQENGKNYHNSVSRSGGADTPERVRSVKFVFLRILNKL